MRRRDSVPQRRPVCSAAASGSHGRDMWASLGAETKATAIRWPRTLGGRDRCASFDGCRRASAAEKLAPNALRNGLFSEVLVAGRFLVPSCRPSLQSPQKQVSCVFSWVGSLLSPESGCDGLGRARNSIANVVESLGKGGTAGVTETVTTGKQKIEAAKISTASRRCHVGARQPRIHPNTNCRSFPWGKCRCSSSSQCQWVVHPRTGGWCAPSFQAVSRGRQVPSQGHVCWANAENSQTGAEAKGCFCSTRF